MDTDAQRPGVAALDRLYAGLEEELAGLSGLFCARSGRCCRFREAGHELYLTRLEFETMRARGGPRPADPDRCPWQQGDACTNRDGRALACRTYFCSDEALSAGFTERWHARLQELHRELGVAYDYRALHDHMAGAGPDPVAGPA